MAVYWDLLPFFTSQKNKPLCTLCAALQLRTASRRWMTNTAVAACSPSANVNISLQRAARGSQFVDTAVNGIHGNKRHRVSINEALLSPRPPFLSGAGAQFCDCRSMEISYMNVRSDQTLGIVTYN